MKSETMTITPKMAEEWLKNVYPRDGVRGARIEMGNLVHPRHVEVLAGDITAGQWDENGAAIILSPENELVDGVHRLAAVVKADKPIRSLVVWLDEVEPHDVVYDQIDAGRVFGPIVDEYPMSVRAAQRAVKAVKASLEAKGISYRRASRAELLAEFQQMTGGTWPRS